MADRVGQQMGNYQLIRLLGEGGFAEVYLGEHIHLGTQAAIKVLHTQITSDDIDKFRTEARTVARLIHPNIVRVLEFGVEGKTPFLVMDYASNGTLRQRHPRGTHLPLASIVNYVKQLAEALQYAHEEKLIHRDIKPENMLLGRRNEILLSDFGIASVAQSSRYQNTQEVAGTVAYMSPEQIQGKPRPASDQYSLAVVVYEWLTRDRPFHGSFTEIATQHVLAPPTALREKDPTISPDVEQVVMTALAKDPKGRFGSIQAFANALEQASRPEKLAPTVIAKSSIPDIQVPLTILSGSPSQVPIPLSLTQPVLSSPVGTLLCSYRGHTGKVHAIAWSFDGQRIASGSDDRTVQLWSALTGRGIYTYRGHSSRVNTVAWSPKRQYIASGSSDQTIQIWDSFTSRKVSSYRVHSGQWVWVRTLAWSFDGNQIASGSEDSKVHIWNAMSGDKVLSYGQHSRPITAVIWSPNGIYIASGSDDKTVQVWNANTGDRIFTYGNHSSTIFAVSWSSNEKYIASGSYDQTVQVWDAKTGAFIFKYKNHSGSISSLAWSPDSTLIASGSGDGTVHIWEGTTGKQLFIYRGHSGPINAVVWSPDGRYIASASDDKTVQVWSAP